MKLNETTAIVTGGASGLGEACARRIVENGGRVGILDLNHAGGEALAEELGKAAVFVPTNVTSADDVTVALDVVAAELGRVNAVVNCAGIAIAQKTLGKDGAHPLDDFRKVQEINLIGSFNVARLTAERMQSNTPNEDGERGVIINTASIAAFDGQKGQSAYAASKGGIASMTLPMARDLAAHGIRVNTMAPGLFLTPMMTSLPEAAQDALAQQPLFPKRLGDPSEIAALACFMIENAYLNASIIRLDGGVRLP
ncbi:3-hydroxyacyl-CoA dehydrogenase [Ruegeria arenilitoris]|uniref:3-hydroxyacyl-CoA dehydrogenase n=1 Tax=Ruegeria arenilitoris TaxID=1173585 RepID=UPI00147DCC19|nr:3-hydroxyacyl-CoA dehydrogenase [Ruegeria arenilitoris]